MKKIIFKKIHSVLSLLFGLIIVTIFATGTLLVVLDLISPILHKKCAIPLNNSQPIKLDSLVNCINRKLVDDKIKSITIYNNKENCYIMKVGDSIIDNIYVNQYTGEIINHSHIYYKFQLLIKKLHSNFLFDKYIGRKVTGTTAILLSVIVVTGLIICFPMGYSQLKKRLHIRISRNKYALFYSIHYATGLYFSFIIILLFIVGLIYNTIYFAKNENLKQMSFTDTSISNNIKEPLNTILINAVNAFPQNEFIEISKENVLSISFPEPERKSEINYAYSFNNKQLVFTRLYDENPQKAKIRNILFILHTSSWGGFLIKILSILGGLLGISLPITGYLLMWYRTKNKYSKNKSL